MALESLLYLLTVHHHAIFFTSYTLLISQETNNETQTKQNKPVKFFRVSCLALLYDVDEVVCEDERYALPLDAKLGLEVAQDVAEVYVKELERRERRSTDDCDGPKETDNWDKTKSLSYLPSAADHDVVTVAVSNAQDVGGYTVACT